MANGYSRSPKLLKGALIEFSERFIGPVPNIIIFQYNPETLSRTLSVWTPPEQGEDGASPGTAPKSASTAQPSDPTETFTVTLELDATDALEEPGTHPTAVMAGVADRIAAMELLLYPQEDSLEELMGAPGGSSGGSGDKVPRGTVPVVLFAWGPGRIVPVRLTSFSVEEKAFSPTLYPIRASVSVGLKILTDNDFPDPSDYSQKIAAAAYKATRKQKQVLAAANLANCTESVLGMLPF